MLVLNDSEHATDNSNIFTAAPIDDIVKSTFGGVKQATRKMLNASNVKFLQSLGFAIGTHTYNPYAITTFDYSDEIRIPIQQQDLYTLPCESFLYVEGTLTVTRAADQVDNVVLGTNCVAFMFDEIGYELDGMEIDCCRNVGITSTLKNYVTVSSDRSVILRNASWEPHNNPNGYFNFCVPLNLLLGFCEDYKRVVINARHEMILIRARNDNNSLVGSLALEPTIKILKIQWRMPHVNTTKHSWAIKTATQLEKPRYVVFALQTGRKNVMSADTSRFDNCNLTNVKLYLNSEVYPYNDLNLDFGKHRWAILYDMYARFCKGYYGYEYLEPSLTVSTFLRNGPFVIIDCSRQNESVKNATVDVRIEFDCTKNVPPNTSAYCLIIHDRVIEYNPLTNVVRKIV
ncbi:uncharacterized protein LOC112458879 [Temnothorax curvispinosus]|uniref:Uncharacterized protein LOC112458879 n=1 Tax=Temnothorax curvispinosus TaxID=300111 RepID=A0A6J1QCJ0_9HYME|nr:uncharacterized protein LOC112458879 [Temnothorax curvispinosus]